jgi:capsid protein
MKSDEGVTIVDGIEFRADRNNRPAGRPVAYWVRTDDIGTATGDRNRNISTGSFERIPASQMLHLFEPCRPGMVRGIPMLYPVMNDLHDLDDLQMLEMKAAKAAAEIANVITNKTGEANVAGSRRSKWQIQSQDANGNATTKNNPLFYEATMGGRNVYISNGEKFEQFRSDRPNVATQEYWDYLVRKICAGVGISSLLIMPHSMQGTVVRADLDTAAAFFRSRSATIEAVVREIYVWVMGWAVKYDRSLDGAPSDWHRNVVRPPRSVTVDIGRNSKAILDELKAGTRTFQDICAEGGMDWRHVLRQRAAEAAYLNDLSKEFKVDRQLISQLAFESVSTSESVSAVVENPDDLARAA